MKLKRHDEFKDLLSSYHVSDRAQKALEDLRLVLLVAISSTGRNTMIRQLLKTGDYYFIISDTTRSPQVRDGELEQHGVNYYFRSEEDMFNDLEAGELLEAAIIHDQQVSGISIRELEKAKRQAKTAITDIEPVGTQNVMKAKPDTIPIFLLPPSFEEWQNRLNARGKMSAAELKNRMASAKRELKAAQDAAYYQFVVADNLDRTVPLVNNIAQGHRDKSEQQRGKEIIADLLEGLISS